MSFATPSSHHHDDHDQQEKDACLHANATISFFTEVCYTYHRQRGEVTEELESHEPELTDEVSVWCPDCKLDTTYTDWWAAPAAVRDACQQIREQHWYGEEEEEEEDDGSFTILIAAEGGQEA